MLDAGPLKLAVELCDPRCDEIRVSMPADDRRIVLSHDEAIAPAELLSRDLRQLYAGFVADDVATQGRGEVLELGDAPVPEPGSAHYDRLECAVHIALHDQLQCRPVDLLGEDNQRTALPPRRFDRRHEILHIADLLVRQQDHR